MAALYPQVVLFGDSLFQQCCDLHEGFSFQAALQAHCIRRYDVVNRGFSGYNTSQALKILPEIFLPPSAAGPKMAYLILLLGANDAALTMPEDNQHVDMDKYEANLARIITHPNVAAHGATVIVVTPPPLDEMRWTEFEKSLGRAEGSHRATLSAAYSEAARRVARSLPGVVLIDLYRALMDVALAKTPGFDASLGTLGDAASSGQSGYLERLLPDGLHLSGESYQILFDAVVPHIKPEHPRTTMEGWVYPEWRVAPWLEE